MCYHTKATNRDIGIDCFSQNFIRQAKHDSSCSRELYCQSLEEIRRHNKQQLNLNVLDVYDDINAYLRDEMYRVSLLCFSSRWPASAAGSSKTRFCATPKLRLGGVRDVDSYWILIWLKCGLRDSNVLDVLNFPSREEGCRVQVWLIESRFANYSQHKLRIWGAH